VTLWDVKDIGVVNSILDHCSKHETLYSFNPPTHKRWYDVMISFSDFWDLLFVVLTQDDKTW